MRMIIVTLDRLSHPVASLKALNTLLPASENLLPTLTAVGNAVDVRDFHKNIERSNNPVVVGDCHPRRLGYRFCH